MRTTRRRLRTARLLLKKRQSAVIKETEVIVTEMDPVSVAAEDDRKDHQHPDSCIVTLHRQRRTLIQLISLHTVFIILSLPLLDFCKITCSDILHP